MIVFKVCDAEHERREKQMTSHRGQMSGFMTAHRPQKEMFPRRKCSLEGSICSTHLQTCCRCRRFRAETAKAREEDGSEEDEEFSVVGGETLCGQSWRIRSKGKWEAMDSLSSMCVMLKRPAQIYLQEPSLKMSCGTKQKGMISWAILLLIPSKRLLDRQAGVENILFPTLNYLICP